MAKIIKITDSEVTIAKDDQTFVKVDKTTLSFIPEVGMEVDLFDTGDEMIVNRVTKNDLQDKININITNANNNVNTQSQTQTVLAVPYGAKSVNKTIYLLLVLFLGWLGVHHFYAGKWMKGAMYFLFSPTLIPGILAFFTFFGTLSKPADAQGRIWV
ncbi:TM2 domain-containing protein [Aerococcaceae bacterium NML180378]|nr:TM2 domain-containing protein [Aerococcaceae bacterium NML180378]